MLPFREFFEKVFPKEWDAMKRFWRLAWRISPTITIAAWIALSIPVGIGAFVFGKWTGTTNIYNNIPAPPMSSKEPPLSNPHSPPTQPAIVQIPKTQPFRLTDNRLPPTGQTIVRNSDGANLPPESPDFNAWLLAGNVPDKAEATLPPVYAPRSPTDADKEIPVIDNLTALLTKQAEQQIGYIEDALSNWQNIFDPAKADIFFQNFADVVEQFRVTSGKTLDAAQPPFCEDDLCRIVDFARDRDKIMDLLDKDRQAWAELRKLVDVSQYDKRTTKMPSLMDGYLAATWQRLRAYKISLDWAKRELNARRRHLSQIASHDWPSGR
jgi:hypothetical protein